MELIRNDGGRVASLVEYLGLVKSGPVLLDTYRNYEAVLATATASEANDALDEVLAGADAAGIESWKIPVSRFIRSISVGLESVAPPVYPTGGVADRMRRQNEAVAAGLAALQDLTRRLHAGLAGQPGGAGSKPRDRVPLTEIRARLARFTLLRDHYVALQNELFPLFERATPRHACVKLMWAIQDDVLALKAALETWPDPSGPDPSGPDTANGAADATSGKDFWAVFGRFYLTASALEYRERLILLPVAHRMLADRDAAAFGAPAATGTTAAAALPPGFSSPTGSVSSRDLDAALKALPFDISFIGPDDRVQYYSDPPGRIFPRSPAVIGRLVQNCHPPKSVATVQEILRSFKSGERDSAEFWLESRGAFIHIQYFAVRDDSGAYLGTLEVSHDATHVRSLQGEKRLL